MPQKFADKPGREKQVRKSQKRQQHFKRRNQRLRPPGRDDGESPFFPIPGYSSAGEY